ncbi:MAG: hypothetical protein AAF716_23155 [Cyanobacteria bacterium P01_D01_bin.1]
METNVVAALEVCDYRQAALLLRQWRQKEPESPLLRLYAAKLQEQTSKVDAAKKNYLALLKQSSSAKAIRQARAGLQRIEEAQTAAKAKALAAAKSAAGGTELTILSIASLPAVGDTTAHTTADTTAQKAAIDSIAKVFNLDSYSARLRLPSSGFRIHRICPWGEASYYAQQLAAPTFCTKVGQIKSLQIFQVTYFESLSSNAVLICKNANGQLGKIGFALTEVSQLVSAQLPIFEQVVDIGHWGRSVHKEKVLDYAQVLDLHLPGRQIVLRLCDRLYQYKKGVAFGQGNEINSRIQWNELRSQLTSSISAPQHSDFTKFGKSALEFLPLLPAIAPNLDLDRRAPSDWDLAFHLYSSLCYFNQD